MGKRRKAGKGAKRLEKQSGAGRILFNKRGLPGKGWRSKSALEMHIRHGPSWRGGGGFRDGVRSLPDQAGPHAR